MWDKKWLYRWIVLLVLVLPTLTMLLLKPWFSIDRALFVYEYFLTGFLFAFNFRSVWPWLVFVFVFTLDIATVFSKLYLFNLPDFLNTFRYLGNYAISPVQFFLFLTTFLLLIGIFVLLKFIKKKIGADKVCLRFFTVILAITFTLDNINGSSFMLDYKPSLNFQKNNFAATLSILLYKNLINRNINSNSPSLSPLTKESVTFKEYASDSTSNQMLIIVESFGFINDSLKREEFQNDISAVFEKSNWKTSWGKTSFTGSTTSAELRELLNCEGDYRYFLKSKQAKNFYSIFQIKKQQGYHTYAIHSYKANMFERATWWKNIGADEVFFSEDVQVANNFQNKLNYESPFTSVNDEDAFNFIQSKTATKGNQFVYILTENAHLPFKGKLKKSMFIKYFDVDKEANLSDEAKNQNKRIMSFLAYVAIHLDPYKFQKLLIVGDHMPPFVKKSDRSFYSDQYVPYCIVTR
jgi:phosphoglycerol transferase MdoB-like AlkP superfamily enzyme